MYFEKISKLGLKTWSDYVLRSFIDSDEALSFWVLKLSKPKKKEPYPNQKII